MHNSIHGTRGIAVAPHAAAAQSALAVLREGGNALEAMIAAAAAIAVVYPHMNSIGGDSFWLVSVPGEAPGAIDACGAAASAASIDWYRERGVTGAIPFRGPLAANTVAGTVSGWGAAYKLSRRALRGRMPLARLLEDAIYYAEHGFPATGSQSRSTAAKQCELAGLPGFGAAYLPDGAPPSEGQRFVQKRLGTTLRRIARMGTEDFYQGEIARSMARDLDRIGSPVILEDLAAHKARLVNPLALMHGAGTVYNLPPPTQGLVSLLILGILDAMEIGKARPNSAEYVHLCVEATKQAFRVRDRYITDPARMKIDPAGLLAPEYIRALAARVSRDRAAPWGAGHGPADTVWMGVVDGKGRAVSFIQSIYHEFGAGVVLEGTGVLWQNRGASFALDPAALNALEPGRKPFHTLNPPLAQLHDGRLVVYGTMGGDGQPQTQCAVFTRTVIHGMDPQAALAAPRWLLGRTWGSPSDTLKLESRFDAGVVRGLAERGHEMEILQPFDETMGHAGCIIRGADGMLVGGADPRGDGVVAAF